ncbi:MAG: nitroreductase family deazaflavin-dependent oxidoreductase [Actinomycetota bacterium]|nr:nitroreductase family deazaflavin-dependent oxidoreductase [Actinomycetota bacterium]
MERVKEPEPPKGLGRILFRLPITLFRFKLGWLLGDRFLLLHHTGRKSGQPRRAVVEVIKHDQGSDAYFAASGYGAQSDWYRNILAEPEVTIEVGRRTIAATATPLPAEEAGEVMVDYGTRHPKTAKNVLAKLMGISVDGSAADFREAGRTIDIIRFDRRRGA